MTEQLNFQTALLYLSYLAEHADGVIKKSEVSTFIKMVQYEGIVPMEVEEFLEFKLEKDEIYTRVMDALKKCERIQQIKALGWMLKIMLVDYDFPDMEFNLFKNACEELEIDSREVTKMENLLPDFD